MIHLLGQVTTNGADPVSYSPLAIVGSVVAFLLWRLKSTDADDRKRIDDCEARLAVKDSVIASKDAEIKEQRSMKHQALNRLAGVTGTLSLVGRLAPNCTCGAMEPVRPLLTEMTKENPL